MHAAKLGRSRQGAPVEDTFLVERPVVGQHVFMTPGRNVAVGEEKRRVVKLALVAAGRAEYEAGAAIAGLSRQGRDLPPQSDR